MILLEILQMSNWQLHQNGTNNNRLTKRKGVLQMSSSQRKRYRDRDRYLQMTPEQKEAYLQRNREYKRMRRDCAGSCSNAKPIPRQKKSRTNNTIDMTGDFSKSIEGKQGVDNSTFHSLQAAWLQENVLLSDHKKHNSACTRQCPSSEGKQGSGGSDTCCSKDGTRFTISSSGIYLSSISSEDQAADYELKTVGQRKRQRCANAYKELSHGQKATCMQENCGHNKRKRSEKPSCNSTQYSERDDNDLHEDIIYVPEDFFPEIHEYVTRTEGEIEYEDVDEESLMYIEPNTLGFTRICISVLAYNRNIPAT